tara:strand:- start:21392 stop:22534 length:1143 start_codon:yes stop_codon:yes gene_type:complete
MIDPNVFLKTFIKSDIRFFAGVPDSLLKEVCACFSDQLKENSHIIATNEGAAISLGIGHYLASSRPALIYLQNSGLGNIINPLISLSHKDIYSIPAILLIGWRGEILESGIQKADEPQHVVQGRITCQQLDLLGIKYKIIDEFTMNIEGIIHDIISESIIESSPIALLVRKNTFSKYKKNIHLQLSKYARREEIIKSILLNISPETIVVATTGMASREVFETRETLKQDHSKDFLTVGGMGHASQIAAGIAIEQPNRKVLCIDGDGALLMHTGSLAVSAGCPNLIHILINNCAHDSVGGQPTKADSVELSRLANVFGYKVTKKVFDINQLTKTLEECMNNKGSTFIEVMSSKGSRSDLGRPTSKPLENKVSIMKTLSINV